jgi:competence protein ComEC
MTHGDVDHIGGAMRVAEDLRPAEIWEGVPVPQHQMVDDLRRATGGTVWRRLFVGHQMEAAGALIDVLHPPLPDWERRRVRNDDSMVLRLRFGLVEILLTGDAGPEFESAFTRDPDSPPIRVLKVGHHGSKTSSSERFLDAYAPTAAVVSAGQGNLFGHPAPVVIGRLSQRDIDVFRTDRDGAIVIETDGRVARVQTATGRVLTVTSPAAMPPPFLP